MVSYNLGLSDTTVEAYMSPKLNKNNTEFRCLLGTLRANNCGIGISRIVKSMAIDVALDAYVRTLTSRQVDAMLLSNTPPGSHQHKNIVMVEWITHVLVCTEA